MRRPQSSPRSQAGSRLLPTERGRRRLAVGLFLACLAFWNGADFLHSDGPEYGPDCPVCHLGKVTSCETPAVSVAPTPAPLTLVGTAAIPRSAPGTGADHSLSAGPRGPPART